MADANALSVPGKRPIHPLKAWRMAQRVWDEERRGSRTMKPADAARDFGVPYTTWIGWEKYPDEPGHRMPSGENPKKLFLFTGGAFTPDACHPIEEWRAELEQLNAEAAGQPSLLSIAPRKAA